MRRLNRWNTWKLGLVGMALAVAGACASGGGISGTSLVLGKIAAFGSIFVNGIEFDTTNAVVTIEGNEADVSELRLGMVVRVLGTVNGRETKGVAEQVFTDHVLSGPVEGVNAIDGTFTSLSQLVITESDTVFDGTTIDDLMAGDDVEVFGFIDADVSIRATRVERKSPPVEIELQGAITNLDALNETFTIGLLTVDFSGALIENPMGGPLADGLFVEIETDQPPVADLFLATGVEVLDPVLMADVGDGVDVAGFVTEIVSPSEFVVNTTQTVIITPDTIFENGSASDVVLNAHVDVEGTLDADGALVAEEIEIVPTGTSGG